MKILSVVMTMPPFVEVLPSDWTYQILLIGRRDLNVHIADVDVAFIATEPVYSQVHPRIRIQCARRI